MGVVVGESVGKKTSQDTSTIRQGKRKVTWTSLVAVEGSEEVFQRGEDEPLHPGLPVGQARGRLRIYRWIWKHAHHG